MLTSAAAAASDTKDKRTMRGASRARRSAAMTTAIVTPTAVRRTGVVTMTDDTVGAILAALTNNSTASVVSRTVKASATPIGPRASASTKATTRKGTKAT